MSEVRLSLDLLEALADRWRAVNAPILNHLRGGLPDEAMDELTASLGLTLPAEARTWWGWHDGVDPRYGALHVEADVGVGAPYPSLETAINQYRHGREQLETTLALAAGLRRDESLLNLDAFWHPTWLPITNWAHGDIIVCECDVPPGEMSSVHIISGEEPAASPMAVADSLGDMVTQWIDAIDSGRTYFDLALGRWRLAQHVTRRTGRAGPLV